MFETEAKTVSSAQPSYLLEMKGEEWGRGAASASGVLPEPPQRAAAVPGTRHPSPWLLRGEPLVHCDAGYCCQITKMV